MRSTTSPSRRAAVPALVLTLLSGCLAVEVSEEAIVDARRDAWVFLRVDEDPPLVLPPLGHPADKPAEGPLYLREEARVAWLRLPSAGLLVGTENETKPCVGRRALLPAERIDARSEACGCCGPDGAARSGEACSLAAFAASAREPPTLDADEAAAFEGWHACLAAEAPDRLLLPR